MNQVTITLTQDHPCDRCGLEVEKDETFCQHCKQIVRAIRLCNSMTVPCLQKLQKELGEKNDNMFS